MTSLADHLRAWGLDVDIVGVPARHGAWDDPRAILVHHTGDTCDPARVDDVLDVVAHGRGGKNPVSGPLAQFMLGQDLRLRIVPRANRGQSEPGRANQAGEGAYPRLDLPHNDGNHYSAGIEVQCSGAHPVGRHPELYRRLVKTLAALCVWWKLPASAVIGHREYAPGRKIDPRDDMDQLRRDVAAAIKAGPGRVAPASKPPAPKEDDVQLTDPVPLGPGNRIHLSRALGRNVGPAEKVTVLDLLLVGVRAGERAAQLEAAVQKLAAASGKSDPDIVAAVREVLDGLQVTLDTTPGR